jgi:hypothetical protein
VHVLLKREGWRVSRNRVYRLYAEEQLQLRSKLPKCRKMVVSRRERCVPVRPNDVWAWTRQCLLVDLDAKGAQGSASAAVANCCIANPAYRSCCWKCCCVRIKPSCQSGLSIRIGVVYGLLLIISER